MQLLHRPIRAPDHILDRFYIISVFEVQTSLLAKHPQWLGVRREGCFCRLLRTMMLVWYCCFKFWFILHGRVQKLLVVELLVCQTYTLTSSGCPYHSHPTSTQMQQTRCSLRVQTVNKLQPFFKAFSRTFQGPPTRNNIISQVVQKCTFPLYYPGGGTPI